MTRYNNPLPHAPVPPSQGRPASAGHHPHHQHQPGFAEPELSGWPQQGATPRPAAPQHRSAGVGSYPDLGYPSHDAPHHDPYAALRPDGYGGAQPPVAGSAPGDAYGLAGYSAPQHAGPQGYGNRAAPQAHQPAYDAYGAQGDPYSAPAQSGGYHQPPQADYGNPLAGHALGGHGAQSHATHGGYAPAAAPGAASHDYAGYAMPPQSNGAHGAGAFGALRADGGQPHAPADQWAGHDPHGHNLALDPHDYAGQDAYADPHAHEQWGGEAYGGAHHADPALVGHASYQNGHAGQHGTLDQSYADDDAMYEDEPKDRGWKKVAVLMACTVLVGGGLAYGFSGLMGGGSGEPTPLVKGAEGPSKVKPSEPGGKRFDHADSTIMGRLGEAGAASDPAGVRKVPVVSVGRDGSIQPPPAGKRDTHAIVSVPGLTVIENFGSGAPAPGGRPPAGNVPPVGAKVAPAAKAPPAAATKAPATASAAPEVKMVTGGNSAAAKKAAPAKAPPAAKAEAPTRVAVAATSAAPAAPSGPRPTGAGYVAVLASVPASASSRIDALTQFADMQQRYGNILSNKTPDIQEANLGEKGTYHRLLVGPPGSRDSANSVCSQLKAQGYSGCWITAY